MAFSIPPNRVLRDDVGTTRTDILTHGLKGITRLLPHAEANNWVIGGYAQTSAVARDQNRRIDLVLGIDIGRRHSVSCSVKRMTVDRSTAGIVRRLDKREIGICREIINQLAVVLDKNVQSPDSLLISYQQQFDELVLASHLQSDFSLSLNLRDVFNSLRTLAEQTYENKSLTFGCIIDPDAQRTATADKVFPGDLLARKRYRALSDGYYTTYIVNGDGKILRYKDLPSNTATAPPRSFFPEWCRDMAVMSQGKRLGISLTRHGDILIFSTGSLRFTYHFGQWQYWNHTHIIDILRNHSRAQSVSTDITSRVVRAIYRAAVAASFRRTGALFVLLKNKQTLRDVVRNGDALNDGNRSSLDSIFDSALPGRTIQSMPRNVAVELSALDGGMVIANNGSLLAYGAVLEPKKKGRASREEGSRTKAAIGASMYGLALKVSSDGDISCYVKGRRVFRI